VKEIFKPYGTPSRRAMALVGIVELALVILVWYFLTPHGIPKPTAVVQAFGYLVDKRSLLYELWVSLVLNVQALAIASVIAYALCYLRPLPFMQPIIGAESLLRYIGVAGLTFTFMVLVNNTYQLKLAILAFAMTPWLVTSMSEVVRSISSEEFDHARTLKMGDVETTWQVIVRGRLADAIEVIRQNVAMSWMMVAAVEGLVRSGGGVGTLLLEESKYLALDQIFATLAAILALGLAQDTVLRLLRSWLCPYSSLN
jgi:NitT/TauT family transport system permease protein